MTGLLAFPLKSSGHPDTVNRHSTFEWQPETGERRSPDKNQTSQSLSEKQRFNKTNLIITSELRLIITLLCANIWCSLRTDYELQLNDYVLSDVMLLHG